MSIAPYTGRNDRDAARYAEYLRDAIRNARRHLEAPEKIYPNGRSSHDVERAVLDEAMEAWESFIFCHGQFDATGLPVGFAH
jgi:hypothetical protein